MNYKPKQNILKMKKLFSVLFAVACVVAMTSSCSKGKSNIHTLQMTSSFVQSYPVVYYADQTTDSIVVTSTDAWTTDTNCSWIVFRQTGISSVKYHFNYSSGVALKKSDCVIFSANTTGAARSTNITTVANGKTVALPVTQQPYLNILNPAKSLTGAADLFSMSLANNAPSADLVFVIYNDATLATEDSWITLPSENYFKGEVTGKQHTATIQLAPNSTNQERRGKVTLKSETGAATDIIIIQKA